ncbi:MBL fold metallo-hydrolase, partial [Candidatus Microgenomates bacterium]|nr:MBL fold metallo-hydrolase [Candidatus Microgenomates bacterium]
MSFFIFAMGKGKRVLAIIFFIIFGLVGIILWQEITINDGKLHLVFCDIGQGDAIFIRTPQKTDILLDGGPDRRVLDCLSKHMPFWDRTIDVVILSHPHQDHFAGLIDVLQSYTVLSFYSENLVNKSAGFRELQNALSAKDEKIRYLSTGDVLKTKDGLSMEVLAPSQTFLDRT